MTKEINYMIQINKKENNIEIDTLNEQNIKINNNNIINNINKEKNLEIIDTNTKIKYKFSFKSFLFGYLAGFFGIIASHPFDTMKTRIQEGKPIDFNLKNLYRGVSAPLIGVGLEKAIVFGTFENTKFYTNSDFISGAISGLTASLVVTPFERIKILLQTDSKINFRNSIKNKIKLGYLYQGFSATLTRETPGFAIYFSVYNFFKNRTKEITPLKSFIYGSFAGTFSWVFIYPQDRIKTHLQALVDKKMGFFEGFKEIQTSGGYTGFYRGFSYALMRAVPLHATAFMIMELCKNKFSL
jgi:solute carrier family 25 carnitine/acylcarnitine transporter 20/29